MRRFADLKLTWKVLAAPAWITMLLICVAWLGVRGLTRVELAFERLDSDIVQPLGDALAVKDGLSLYHARMVALLSTAGNDAEVAKTREVQFNRIAMELRAIEQATTSQSAGWTRQVDAASVTAMFTALDAYADAARGLGEAAKADITYGVLMLGDANAKFEALRSRLDGVVGGLQLRRQQLTGETHQLVVADRRWLAVLAGVAVLLGLALALVSARLITRPVVALTSVMGRLAEREMSVEVEGTSRHDEVGAMARAVEVFKRSMIEGDRLAAERDREHAAREVRQEETARHTKAFGDSITDVMGALDRSSDSMREAAITMDTTASGVRQQAGDTAERASRTSRDLDMVAAAVEELTGSVGEISRQVATAAEVAREAVRSSEYGHGAMQGLDAATAHIGDVVQLINGIASQTNLLALNATIEAARAGEAGKGFAVVAGEVKVLAGQTAKATSEISRQIAAVRGATQQSIAAMQQVGQIIARLDEIATSITVAVGQQTTTTRAIAVNVQGIADATQQTTRAMEQVAGVANEAGAASHSVLEAAATVGREAQTLRGEVDNFLEMVRGDIGGTVDPEIGPHRAAA